MTNGEFVDILGVTLRLESWPDDIPRRELHIHIERNRQGAPESVTLDFIRRGHERFLIVMGDLHRAAEQRPLWVDRRMIASGHRKIDACCLIEDLLAQYGALPMRLTRAA